MVNKNLLFGVFILFSIGFAFAITGNVVEGFFESNVTIDSLIILADTFNWTTTDFSSLNTLELNNLSLFQ